jgi:uncharacterized lipoprotein YddW (UPF0748 family)
VQIRLFPPHVLTLLLAASCLWACLPLRVHAQGPELRGFWADGFNEGYKTPQQIDTLLQRLHDAHCNAIFAQMRKGGDAYYASRYEPWATDDAAHFDALACLIDRAHRMQPRIAVHAWINTCAVGQGLKHPRYHVAQVHPEWLAVNARGNADDGEVRKVDLGDPDAADWTFRLYLDVVRHYDVDGIHFDFVRYGSPNFGYNPVSVKRFLRQLPTGYKMRPYRRGRITQRLAEGRGETSGAVLPAPDDPAWKQWRRDQVTNFVRKVYAFASRVKPRIVVSAATIAWGNGPASEEEWQLKSAAMNRVFQDWRGWQQEGILDLACPMTYFAGRRGLEYERTWHAWVTGHQYQRASAIAVGNWQLTIPQTLAQMRVARTRNWDGRRPYGVMLYSYAGTNSGQKQGRTGLYELELQPEFYAMLGQSSLYAKTPPFAADVPLPSMPWKEHPSRGILKGFVHKEDMTSLDGALVTVEPQIKVKAQSEGQAGRRVKGSTKRYTRRVDGTGFYALVNLPPGVYTARVSSSSGTGHFKAEPQRIIVQAAQVSTGDFWMQAGQSDTVGDLQTIPQRVLDFPRIGSQTGSRTETAKLRTGLRVRVDGLTVLIGTDTWPQNLYAQDKAGAALHIRLAASPLIPFQPGDSISVLGLPARDRQEPILDSATACLTDIALLPEATPLPTLSGANLSARPIAYPDFVRVQGRVLESDSDGFVLDAEGRRIQVSLSGRKDFGVESAALLPAPPLPGSIVSVRGYLRVIQATPTQANDGGKPIELLPRTSADIVIVTPPPLPGPQGFRWTLLLFALILFALIAAFFWHTLRHLRTKTQS